LTYLIDEIYFFINKKSIYLLEMESIPYDKRSGKIWFNGKTVDWADANIHILNHGLHYASCVFEGERGFMMGKYLNRRTYRKIILFS
jgi:branched-chain amino acid aminotransferase